MRSFDGHVLLRRCHAQSPERLLEGKQNSISVATKHTPHRYYFFNVPERIIHKMKNIIMVCLRFTDLKNKHNDFAAKLTLIINTPIVSQKRKHSFQCNDEIQKSFSASLLLGA